jgi:hypothetical protein
MRRLMLPLGLVLRLKLAVGCFALGLGLLASAPASALSMQVVGSNVFVDVFVRAENQISDRPARSGPNLQLDTGVAVFVAPLQSATGVASAESGRLPFLARPQLLTIRSELDVQARTKSAVEAEAESIGGGSVRIQLLGSLAEAPAAALAFNITLGAVSQQGIDWNLEFSVFNETLGTTVFAISASDESPSVPTEFATPGRFGDILRVDWFTRIYAFASDGNSSQGSLDFSAGIITLPIPEPQTLLLLLGGLTALGSARRTPAAVR